MSTTTSLGAAPGVPGAPGAAPRGPARRWSWRTIALLGLAVVLIAAVLRVVTGENDTASSGALAAALGLAVPIGLAGLGGLWSERAGVVNIGLEGMMILGTWGAAYFAMNWGPWAGILGGIVLGAVGGALHALATVTFGVDHVVSGVAINLIGMGGAKYLAARTFVGTEGGGASQSPPLPSLPSISIPGLSDGLRSIEGNHWFFVSDLAGIVAGLFTDLSVLTLLAVALMGATWWVLWRTAFGLRLRSCGEAPVAAETLGVNVYRYKWVAVLVSGALAGLGGAYLSLVADNIFRDGQTGGRGYIGLAAMIFGNWRPGSLAGGSLLFGYFDAIQLRGNAVHALLLLAGVLLIGYGLWRLVTRSGGVTSAIVVTLLGAGFVVVHLVSDSVPGQLTSLAPYLATLLVLALASQSLRMPAADGKIYRKGEGH